MCDLLPCVREASGIPYLERAVDIKQENGKLVVDLEPVGMERLPETVNETQVHAPRIAYCGLVLFNSCLCCCSHRRWRRCTNPNPNPNPPNPNPNLSVRGAPA